MSIIREFVTKLPAACGVPEGLAEIYGELNGKLFDFELANPDGPLNRKNFSSAYERLALGVDPWKCLVPIGVANYAIGLLAFMAKTTYAKGGDWDGKEWAKNQLSAEEKQPYNAPVASLMTVEEASTLGNWA
jgi:hypothetical protein